MQQVNDYIASFPLEVQAILKQIRKIIVDNAPDVIEHFSYGMPAYKLNGKPLVYFAAFKNHIGFYATPSGHTKFSIALSKYKQGKGSVQFPLAEPIPFELMKEMVLFRVWENEGRE
ncbi:MAG: DUF1801 domain-containing protein [Bacteroidota bacterium]|nr:DUF1801 domain-containing protein [Bacteroidota bacterium]